MKHLKALSGITIFAVWITGLLGAPINPKAATAKVTYSVKNCVGSQYIIIPHALHFSQTVAATLAIQHKVTSHAPVSKKATSKIPVSAKGPLHVP